ncbi:N-acetylglucosamine kinase [Microbacterium sp. UFMG61]|uniref:N-acetylglucosamine kinase n=1 Tax=Microbacterium sp. UFMG61 TaxID=2745935 RepID=UPI00188FDE64|nr:BadF/BadG/BcrA/BcrD ATPase family protein [Microbacterium sp. UFMG61]
MPTDSAVLAVDLGKSRCRAVLFDSERRLVFDGAGAPGLAARDGVAAALAAVLPALDRVRTSSMALTAVSVGAAGAWAAPAAAAEFARRLATAAEVRSVVASDVVSAHVGALGGGPGVLLIAGTGAAALGIEAESARLIDGWGPELGDFGSGSWLGREALRAVLRAAAGQGERTSLERLLRPAVGEASDIQSWMSHEGPLARRLASLAPVVLDAAEAGDAVASRIVREAARLLTGSAESATALSVGVALHGGLTDHPWFRSELERALVAAGRDPLAPRGDALDGARLLAERSDLPHERFVHRAD